MSTAVALSGDSKAFQDLTRQHERELLVHCYRMLGSLEDAEDALQETFLRAWRKLDSFEGRSSLRAWLYRIATNASLDALDKRRRRAMPTGAFKNGKPGDPFPAPLLEGVWLEPLPDALVDERPQAAPEARYATRESVSFAFLAALQHLPGRQRAALILCEVLDWSAQETSDILEMSVAAVNSALQRARATMKRLACEPGSTTPPAGDARLTASLLNRYVTAWEAGDADGLVALLREDAAMTMPPLPLWFRGREDIRQFVASLFAGEAWGRFHLVSARANSCPAFGVYQRDESGKSVPSSLHVLTLNGSAIAEIHSFLTSDPATFARFDLPSQHR